MAAALKEAYLFLYLPLKTTRKQYGMFTFDLTQARKVKYKGDNFATAIDILVNSLLYPDMFEYRYITFDKTSLFKIKSVIQNGNYYRVYVEYMGAITISDSFENTEYYIDEVTPAYANRGLNISLEDFTNILGRNRLPEYINRVPVIQGAYGEENPFIWALRITFSAIPASLATYLEFALTTKWQDTGAPTGEYTSMRTPVLNMTKADSTVDNLKRITEFNASDEGYVCIIPLPQTSYIQCGIDIYLRLEGFINALRTLSTDLVRKMELIPLGTGTLCVSESVGISLSMGYFKLNNDFISFVSDTPLSITMSQVLLKNVRGIKYAIDNGDGATDYYPVFLMGVDSNFRPRGIVECRRYFYLNTISITARYFPLQLEILRNVIDVSKVDFNKFPYICAKSNGLELMLSEAETVTIQNSVEYSVSAFSNYEAYTKANINLINDQKQEETDLINKQNKQKRKVDAIQNTFSTMAQATTAALMGNYAGAASTVGAFVGGAITDAVSYNMDVQHTAQQNALARQQALEAAQYEIVPTSQYNGAISLSDIITKLSPTVTNNAELYAWRYIYIPSGDNQQDKLLTHIADNLITLPFEMKTSYQPLYLDSPFYVIKLVPNSPLNSRSTLYVLGSIDES